MLKNPTYAGAYVYGRRQVQESLDDSLRPKRRMREVERQKWHVLLKDHHEGYISWEQFERHQQQIRSNWRASAQESGAAREGDGLLQGLVLCGRCGRRMRIAYGRGSRPTRYWCSQARRQTGEPVCQGFGARRLEQAVERVLLRCLSPLGMESMLEAARLYVEEAEEAKKRQEQRLERARYEANLARRQYEAVDPENRLVARELERRYEKALRVLQEVESEVTEELERLRRPLSAEQERQLMGYAEDLHSLWQAPTTRAADRKRLARCVIEAVVVSAPRESSTLSAKVHWKGGEVTVLEVPKGRSGVHRYVSSPELVQLVGKLATEFSDAQIARILRRKGMKTPKGHSFMPYHVANVRQKHDIPPGPRIPLRTEDVYTAEQAAELLDVCHSTVIRWVEAGLLRGTQATAAAPWRIMVTKEDIAKLKPTEKTEGWVSLKAAAAALRISQHVVLQKVNSGELRGARVRSGRRVGWRIHLPVKNYDDQPTLL
jgi:hypothetical protein